MSLTLERPQNPLTEYPSDTEPETEIGIFPVVLHTRPAFDMSSEDFFAFCQVNRDWRIERTAEGNIVIMAPAGAATGGRNAILTSRLFLWALQEGTGVSFDSSTGYRLPGGGDFATDASWVRKDRLTALSSEQKRRFLPLAPDFAIELRSPSDSLTTLQTKMETYRTSGVRLGWLLDPTSRTLYVYRPNTEVETLAGITTLSADPELPGFTLDLTEIWDLRF